MSDIFNKDFLAWHYKQYSDNERLTNLEKVARKNEIGLWGSPTPVAPWSYRRHNK